MASTRTLFRQLARETDRPEQLVGRLGRALWEEHGGTPYLTCFLARLDLADRSMFWVNAGHPPALLVAGATHRALGSTGPPAGLLPDVEYDARTEKLTGGEALVLVTDGVTEALEADGRVEERLAWTVAHKSARGPQAICQRVMRLARSGRGPVGAGDWQDDRTVVAVTLDPA
jgi:sigma-B regulation protein RsbU (phosphoserine phosphatase)